jgi:hypothetical protein
MENENILSPTMGGKDEDKVNPPQTSPISSERREQVTEAQQISYLENKETNFVFIFGKRAAGKTVITASLLNYLSSHCDFGTLVGIYDESSQSSNDGRRTLETIRRKFSEKRLPARTDQGSLTEIDIKFDPLNKSKRSLWLTFLEMAGEDLEKVDLNENSRSQFPTNIDVFFKANNLSMIFILVTSHNEAYKDDSLMVQFLDYIISRDARFQNSRILLLISQWDTFQGVIELEDFLKTRMPLTFARLRKNTNAFRHFSIGRVAKVDDEDFIREYDSEPAEEVFHWLYRTLTGESLKSRWEWLKKYF